MPKVISCQYMVRHVSWSKKFYVLRKRTLEAGRMVQDYLHSDGTHHFFCEDPAVDSTGWFETREEADDARAKAESVAVDGE